MLRALLVVLSSGAVHASAPSGYSDLGVGHCSNGGSTSGVNGAGLRTCTQTPTVDDCAASCNDDDNCLAFNYPATTDPWCCTKWSGTIDGALASPATGANGDPYKCYLKGGSGGDSGGDSGGGDGGDGGDGGGDVSSHPKTSFSGDLDPLTRQISGTITVQAHADAANLQGFRLYPSADGLENLAGEPATHAINLPKSCPPDANNDDNDHVTAANSWSTLAAAPCNNNSPYSPKCDGASCSEILIKAGSDGEYYITRYDNTADQTVPDSYVNNYGESETATIYLPSSGTLVPVSLAVHTADSLTLDHEPDSLYQDLGTSVPGAAINLVSRESVVHWSSNADGETDLGWTLMFTPNYPTVVVTNEYMTDGAGGFRVVPVTGDSGTGVVDAAGTVGTDSDSHGEFAETYDWIVPNTTCTPTTMLCPIPTTWAHIDYSTPLTTPEPAEGQCAQQKSGSSDFEACEAAGKRWAGNCGDASSYFWFEKIACGSERLFHTDRSVIEDRVELTPSAAHIQEIKDLYYTTKAPEERQDFGGGVRFVRPDYHVAPLLPPTVECSCLASMDAYASLLSVVSKTPTPDAPETLDPEILNSGTSKIVATLRVYNDPTYSIPHDSSNEIPLVVQRFYLEVSTKFTRNHITISDCTAANTEALLNDTDALKPRTDYCDSAIYDTQDEGVPTGITHMDRISMKKFKFGDSTDVFMQCKIRACAAKPCDTCDNRRQLDEQKPRKLQESLAPMEGEMFAPPTQFRIGAFDNTALVFDPIQASAPVVARPAVSSPAQPTSQPLQVQSEISLPLSPSWAIENRESLTQTLRTTLGLLADEDLVITRISAAPRRLDEAEQRRKLQAAGGVKIDFVVGLTQPARATQARATLTALSSGQTNAVQTFTTQLDSQLQVAGKPVVALSPQAVAFSAPEAVRPASAVPAAALGSAAWSWSPTVVTQPQQNSYTNVAPQQEQAPKEESESSGPILLILACCVAGFVVLLCFLGKCSIKLGAPPGAQQQMAAPVEGDAYQGKTHPDDFQ